MNKTANFQLTQWEKTDRIMMEDFNRDNAAIDTALKGNADKAAALQTALAGAGNCEIGMISYTGTGKSGAGQLRKLQDRIRHIHRKRQIRQRESQQADL